MDPTLEFLWNRRLGGQRPNAASQWAIGLLECGYESEAIMRLSGDSQLDCETTELLVCQALQDLQLNQLLNDDRLDAEYERASIADYYAGLIDGWTLIQRGCNLYYKSGARCLRAYWIMIAEDADQHGGQGICAWYPFNARPFDEALREALVQNGFPAPASSH